MPGLPDVLFVIDSRKEAIAVQEARKLGIPLVAVVDTNCNPDDVDFVIPGNDDALRAVRLFASTIADAIIAGQQMHQIRRELEVKDQQVAGGDGQPVRRSSSAPEFELGEGFSIDQAAGDAGAGRAGGRGKASGQVVSNAAEAVGVPAIGHTSDIPIETES